KTNLIIYSLGIALVSTHSILAQDVLPKPEQAFTDAKIGRTYKDSQPGTMVLTKAPAGAPNVLIILIDDAASGNGALLVDKFLRPIWIDWRKWVCAIRGSTPPRFARRRARRY